MAEEDQGLLSNKAQMPLNSLMILNLIFCLRDLYISPKGDTKDASRKQHRTDFAMKYIPRSA
jgi:hypothetical protein